MKPAKRFSTLSLCPLAPNLNAAGKSRKVVPVEPLPKVVRYGRGSGAVVVRLGGRGGRQDVSLNIDCPIDLVFETRLNRSMESPA